MAYDMGAHIIPLVNDSWRSELSNNLNDFQFRYAGASVFGLVEEDLRPNQTRNQASHSP